MGGDVATSGLLRTLNAAAVLNHLRGADEVTGSEVMAATGLSRPTVHAVCDHLIALGWVREMDGRRPAGSGRPGRPARCYRFNSTAGYVVGVDLGAGKVRALLMDLRGAQIAETVRVFSDEWALPEERMELTRAAMSEVMQSRNVDSTLVLGVAVGVPAPVGADGRVNVSEDYLPGLAHVDIAAEVAVSDSSPVIIENDANLAALAERWRGAGIGVDNLVVILSGERLGSGIIADGRLIRGFRRGAGELGFLGLVTGVGDAVGIGRLAREWASAEEANELMPGVNNHDQRRFPPLAFRGVDATAVFDAANAGDPSALAIIDRIGDRMARVVGIIATFVDPEVVVIGGAVANASDVLVTAIKAHAAAYTPRPPRIVASTLGERGVAYGAARLALDDVETNIFNSIR